MDAIPASEVTVSIVRETKPEGLFKYFEKHGFKVTKPYSGIYYIERGAFFPTQIIVGKELNKENHTWLKALSYNITKQDMYDFLSNINNITQKFDKELADSVLEVSVRANYDVINELRGEISMSQALLEIMKPEIDKIVDKIVNEIVEKAREDERKETEKRNIIATVKRLRQLNLSNNEINNIIIEDYNLTEEEAEAYLQ